MEREAVKTGFYHTPKTRVYSFPQSVTKLYFSNLYTIRWDLGGTRSPEDVLPFQSSKCTRRPMDLMLNAWTSYPSEGE